MTDLTISAAARELKKRRDSVVALIKSGALQGYDVTAPGDKRKSYRITRQALDDFKARRSAQATPVAARKKAPKPQNMVQYF